MALYSIVVATEHSIISIRPSEIDKKNVCVYYLLHWNCFYQIEIIEGYYAKTNILCLDFYRLNLNALHFVPRPIIMK